MRALARKGYTRAELEVFLVRKGADRDTADLIITEFEERGWLDDLAVAEDHIHRGRGQRAVGRRLIERELSQRGINETDIQTAISIHYQPAAEEVVARDLVRRRRSQYRGLSIVTQKRRIAGLLERRGFPAELIAKILREYSTEDVDSSPTG